MCFGSMSQTSKDLTASTVNLAQTMARQAGKVFGAADKTFNTISNAMTSIVNRGESQFGFSNGEFTAMNAATVNAGAAEQRNLRGQAAASGQPVNTAAIDQKVAGDTASAENATVQAGYAQGNKNFFAASKDLGAAPDIYGVADKFNSNAMGALGAASTAQTARDASGGGWKNLAKAGIAYAGDVGGSFIGDPGLGGQIDAGLSAVGFNAGKNAPGGNATSQMFGNTNPVTTTSQAFSDSA
jgi:hypothetical protein